MADSTLKMLEPLLKKSTDEQQKGVAAALDEAITKKDVPALQKIVQFGTYISSHACMYVVLTSQQLAGAHRCLLDKVAERVKDLGLELIPQFAPKMLELMSNKTMASELSEYKIRKELAAAYGYEQEYQLAARTIADIHLEQIKE